MFCERCGAKLEGDEKFCTECGAVIKQSEKKIQYEEPGKRTEEKAILYENKENVSKSITKNTHNSRKKYIICSSVFILVCLVLGLVMNGTWFEQKQFRNALDSVDYGQANDLVKKHFQDEGNEIYSEETKTIEIYLCTEEIFNGYSYRYEYDQYGNNTKKSNCYASGEISDWEEYEYDNKGNMISHKVFYEDGLLDSHHEYEYNQEQKIIRDLSYNSDGTVYTITDYQYDNLSNLINETTVDTNNEILYQCKFFFDDEQELMKKESYYSSYGTESVIYEYDKNHVCEFNYGTDGSYLGKKYLTYNEDGQLAEEQYIRADGYIMTWIVYKYNNGKLENRFIKGSDGTVKNTYLYLYDANGNLEREDMIYADGTIETICYYKYELFEILEY